MLTAAKGEGILKMTKLKPNVKAKEGKYKYLSALRIAMGIIFETGTRVIKDHRMQNKAYLLFFLNLKMIKREANKITKPDIILRSEYEGGKSISYLTFRFIGKSSNFI